MAAGNSHVDESTLIVINCTKSYAGIFWQITEEQIAEGSYDWPHRSLGIVYVA